MKKVLFGIVTVLIVVLLLASTVFAAPSLFNFNHFSGDHSVDTSYEHDHNYTSDTVYGPHHDLKSQQATGNTQVQPTPEQNTPQTPAQTAPDNSMPGNGYGHHGGCHGSGSGHGYHHG